MLWINNSVAISFTRNPILHSRDKHIEIKDHFIRDHVQKDTIDLEFVPIDNQLTNIFTKPLVEKRFQHLRTLLGMIFIKEGFL